MSAIEVQGLRKRFRVSRQADHRAVDDVTFTVPEADLLVLLGASGCGKTTTLRCLAGLEQPDDGSIRFGERTVYDGATGASTPTHKRDIGLVFQTFALWPHMSAWRNIRFPLESRGTPRGERDARVQQVAELVDLDSGLLSKRPGQLSGGQQQRVSLARALVGEPSVVLFDEPLSNLDALLREQLRGELRDLHRRLGFTAVYVTHDLSEALALGTQVAVMRAGRIEQLGPPADVFDRPASPSVARLLGHRPVGTCTYSDGAWTGAGPSLARFLDGFPAVEVALFARPEAMECRPVDSAPGAGRVRMRHAVLREATFVGSGIELLVDVDGHPVRMSGHGDRALLQQRDVSVAVDVDAGRLLAFPVGAAADTGAVRAEPATAGGSR